MMVRNGYIAVPLGLGVLALGVIWLVPERPSSSTPPPPSAEALPMSAEPPSQLDAAHPSTRELPVSASGPRPTAPTRRNPPMAEPDTPATGDPITQDTIRSKYPAEWEVALPTGTRLDSLRRQLDQRLDALPLADLEDQTPIPIWFRVFLRIQHGDLPTSGPRQYPRTATRLLQWMIAHPDSIPNISP